MKKITTILISLIIVLLNDISGQDIHFSQFAFSPLNLNPALTGFFDGDYRVVANYRNQWGSVPNARSFRTMSGSVEGSFFKGLLNNDYLGAGIVFTRDEAGTLKLTNTSIGASLAYSLRFGTYVKHAFAVGFYGSYVLRDLSFQNVIFPEQLEQLGNPDDYVDMAAGFIYHIVPRERLNMIIGGAYHHINEPVNSYLGDNNEVISPKYSGHINALIEVGNNINVLPSVLFLYQDPSYQLNVGSYVQFILGESFESETSFALGAWTRIVRDAADAVIFGARFDHRGFTGGISYDVNVSELSSATGNKGGFEVSLIYSGSIVDRRNKGPHCPTF